MFPKSLYEKYPVIILVCKLKQTNKQTNKETNKNRPANQQNQENGQLYLIHFLWKYTQIIPI